MKKARVLVERSRRRTGAALTGALLLLGALTACAGDNEPTSLSAAEVFYLSPHSNQKLFPLRVDGSDFTALTGKRRLTVDVPASSRDVVRLRESSPDCTGSATHVTCDIAGTLLSGGTSDFTPLAAKGSKPGDTGQLRLSYGRKDGRKLTARTRVVVGAPVLEVLTPKAFKGVRPGAEVTSPVVVRNTGDVTANGLVLVVNAGDLEFARRHANCRYPDLQHGSQAVCRFPDVRIPPGKAVTVRSGLRLRASDTKMYGSFNRAVWPLDAGPGQNQNSSKGGDHGDGPALRAEPAKTTSGRFTRAGDFVDVLLDTHADYEVSGADLHGDPGDTRKLRLTVRNDGPGDPGYAARLIFSPPLGVTVLKQPTREIDEDEYQPYCDNNGSTYTCDVERLEPGTSRTFEFTVRLGEPGKGSVSLLDIKPPGRRDTDPSDDEASVDVLG